tara:strand:+ start:720 stop:1538 length:819 start_codon:yes stop_codon:yes gene_type:complete
MVSTNITQSQDPQKNYSVLNKYDWAWDLIESTPDLDQKTGLTFVALVHYANLKTGAAFPSRQRLRKRSKNSESSLRRALSRLKKLGLVEEANTYRPEKYTTGAPSKGWKVNFPWLEELPVSVTDNYEELPVSVTALNQELPVSVTELPVNVTGPHYIREQELTRKKIKPSSSVVSHTTTKKDDEILKKYSIQFREFFVYWENTFPGEHPNFFGRYADIVDLLNMDSEDSRDWNTWQKFISGCKNATSKAAFFMTCIENEHNNTDKPEKARYI